MSLALSAASTGARSLAQATDPLSYGFTPARMWASAAALLALAGVAIGGWALARSRRRGANTRTGAIVALSAGAIAAPGGVLSLAVADGGPGTGNGVVGAGAAVVLGLGAIGLGWPALTRARRTVR